MRARYSNWDDTQGDPLGPDVDVGEVLEEMSEDLLSGFSADSSLDWLYRRGMSGRFSGLDSLMNRVRAARARAEEQIDLSGPLARVKERLDDVVATERAELARRIEDDARMKEAILDALPPHPAGAIRELMSYNFESSEARAKFEALVEELQQEVLDSYFRNLSGSMRNISPEDVARLKDMLAELNAMIEADARGDPYDFDGFMERYGDFFPENPRNLKELLEIMARRAAAMSRLMASLSPEQRQELADLASAVLDDLDLAFQVDQLTNNLRELMPNLPWDEPSDAWGDQTMPMSQTIDVLERVGEYEELEQTLSGDYPGASIEDIDEDKIRRALDDDAVADVRRLKEIERALERAGVLNRRRGRLELTARGARLLGERALTRLLERIRREPSHRARGGGAEPTWQTRRWSFGDTDPISIERTVYNAVARSGTGKEVALMPDDFEVVETETRPRTATALLLDLSFSMPLRGHWLPAKRMALALHALIEGKYPQDSLHLIGFSDYARKLRPEELAQEGWERVQGTNMQHAFILARRVLAGDPRPTKQVIMVTDGEPTAHLDGDHALFNWPPIPETIEKTLREAMRLARSAISINVFMLEETDGLLAFMHRLAHLTGGKTYLTDHSEIGVNVMREYLGGRTHDRVGI
jgi:uncharacterized protein with von Willebrand factor type A (vWA) domain